MTVCIMMKGEARKLLERAKCPLHATESLMAAGEAEFAAGCAYYAMLHTAQARLREKNLPYRKRSSVIPPKVSQSRRCSEIIHCHGQ